ncbi:serine/threonine protein kinase [Gigaspora margarita]|uniref:Serine/threonine protein kinase n=1 Tax=Gigaspora margarita TaxID=4874 RepID=A0A8H4AVL4_GIGMA|nr:serine/threonine protein kinase [Gigaspora margarita]
MYATVACTNCRKSRVACSGEPNCPRCRWRANTDRFRRPYISTACYPCKLAKVKCSGGIPCDRCSKRIYSECIYTSKSDNIRRNKFGKSLDFDERNKIFDESLMICSLCSISGKFSNHYYQCEICINEFGLGSSGNKMIDEFLNSEGDQFIWIPYNVFQDIKYLSKGGFGMVYKATWKQIEVVLKSLYNSNNMNIEFLKEVESLKKFKNYNGVVQIYGITRDPLNKNYSMVMKYISGGDLYDYLKKSYKRLTWKNKIVLIWDIAKR